MDETLRCQVCGDVIGTYEPLVVLASGEARHTSRAAERDLLRAPGEHYHRDCFLTAREADQVEE